MRRSMVEATVDSMLSLYGGLTDAFDGDVISASMSVVLPVMTILYVLARVVRCSVLLWFCMLVVECGMIIV